MSLQEIKERFLSHLPAEERLQGLSVQERLGGLSEEQLTQIAEAAQQLIASKQSSKK